MKFYATLDTRECSKKTEFENAGFLDLHCFDTAQERNRFVKSSKFAKSISPREAFKSFSDQLRYLNSANRDKKPC